MDIRAFLLFGFICGCLCAESDHFHYLPKNVKPLHYNLTLEPNLKEIEACSFKGNIIIEVRALEATSNITFHTKNITIHEESLKISSSNATLKISNTTYDEVKEFYIITLEEPLEERNNYVISIDYFEGILEKEPSGFFLANYIDPNGTKRYLTLSEFEPMHAREAFPCFDEPDLKATFQINLIRPSEYTSASNEDLLTTLDLGGGRFKDVYKETLPMSTYLVAFVISDFVYTENNDRIRILSKKETIENGRTAYSLNESLKMLEALEEFTSIKYKFKKLDLVAIPKDYFVDGAMENWGLIIYNENHLLFSNLTSNTDDLQRCATYTAHEIAHQWFGNLVTPSKWNYMWLSEGFAAYFQFHIADVVEPSWRLQEQFVIQDMYKSMDSDVPFFSEPVNFVFNEYNTFPSAFTYYYKASSIIRMMAHFLTHSTFQEGLQIYLKKNEFQNAEPPMLYEALDLALTKTNTQRLLGNLTLEEIMDTWNNHISYPLIEVHRDYTNGDLTFTQEVYKTEGDECKETLWMVPLTYVHHPSSNFNFSNTLTDFWLTQKSLNLRNFSTEGFVLVNKQQIGYYRVNYDLENWRRIIDFLKTEDFVKIHPLNRAQLINDAFTLASDAKLPFEVALNLSQYLKQETDYIPIKAFQKHHSQMQMDLVLPEIRQIFKYYTEDLLSMVYEKLGLEDQPGDDHVDKLNRMAVGEIMCSSDDKKCKDYALEKLRRWMETGIYSFTADLGPILLCNAIKIASCEEWDFLLEQYYEMDNKELKTVFIKSLGCTQNITIIHKALDALYNPNVSIIANDRVEVYSKMMDNHLETILNYIKELPSDLPYIFEDATNLKDEVQGVPAKLHETMKYLKNTNRLKNIPVQFYQLTNSEENLNEHGKNLHNWFRDYGKALEKANEV